MADRLIVRGAREHNLKDVSLDLPRDALIVFTGLSGSGKSSLAFDTIFAEGQRRYVESLSAYARQFLGQMDKPDVDFIEGLSPAVSIDQKSTSKNPRSTVGTITEVYDYLRLLWARIGHPHCPVCGRADPQADPAADRRPGAGARGGHPLPGARPGRTRPQGRIRRAVPRAADQGLLARPGRRRRSCASTRRRSSRSTRSTTSRSSSTGSASRTASRRRLADSVETALGADRRHGHPRLRRPARGRRAARADVLRAPLLPLRRPVVRRAGAAVLLVQLAVRRLPGLHRPGHPHGGRPRAARARRREVARRGRDLARGPAATSATTSCGCSARSARRSASTSTRRGSGCPPRRARPSCTGHDTQVHVSYRNRYGRLRSYYTTYEGVIPYVQRRHSEAESDSSRERFEGYMREIPCPLVRGPPAQAGRAGRHGQRPVHRRRGGHADRRVRQVPAGDGAQRPREAHRRAGPQGDQRPAGLPARRRAGLPHARPCLGDARRRRGAAHPAGHPDRLRPGRRALRPGRAVHRPAPARQPPAARDADPAARHRQHADRRRARRGHHPRRRLGRRHRPRRGRARRPGRRHRHRRGAAEPRELDDRRLPVRPARRSRSRQRRRKRAARAASWSSRARTSTTCRTSTSRSRSACSPRSPACRDRASPRWSTTSSTTRWPSSCTAHARVPGRHKRINGLDQVDKVVHVDQSPIGRTPRSNPATYTGVFDHVRKLFAADDGGEGPRLPAGPVLLQRQGRPLRGVLGRRHDQDRDAVPAGRLRPLRGLPRRPLQPRDPGGPLQGQDDLRGPRHADRGGAGLLRGHPGHPAPPADPQRRRPRLRPARPARADAVRRRGAAGQARLRAAAALHRAHDLRPRRADHRPALRGHPQAARRARPPGRRRQHRHRHRAQPRRHQDRRLDHRHGPRGRFTRRHASSPRARPRTSPGSRRATPASSCAKILGPDRTRHRGPAAVRVAAGHRGAETWRTCAVR